MPFSASDLVYGIVLPVIVAAGLSWLWRRRCVGEQSWRWATIVPFVAAFQLGYWLIPLGPMVPESHWHWLPWILLLTLAAGIPLFADANAKGRRLALSVVVAGLTAWLIVPSWDHLEPSRTVHLVLVMTLIVVVATLLEPLTRRFSHPAFSFLLAMVMTSAAVLLALAGSLRFAQMAVCGAAALTGIAITGWFHQPRNNNAGIALPLTVLITSLMLIGRVNSFSDVPLVSYLLLPVAPLSLWLVAAGPLSATSGLRRWLLLAAPLIICGIAIAIAGYYELPGLLEL